MKKYCVIFSSLFFAASSIQGEAATQVESGPASRSVLPPGYIARVLMVKANHPDKLGQIECQQEVTDLVAHLPSNKCTVEGACALESIKTESGKLVIGARRNKLLQQDLLFFDTFSFDATFKINGREERSPGFFQAFPNVTMGNQVYFSTYYCDAIVARYLPMQERYVMGGVGE